jgi:DNA-binding NarL/FixJ family response regulator
VNETTKKEDGADPRVLIVDDDTIVAEVLASFLNNIWNCEMTVLSDVASAREFLREGGPVDLALVDFRMPGSAGLAFVEDIVALNSPRPVVVVSGKIGPQAIRATIAAGAKGFISKKIGARQMLRRLEIILKGEVYIPPELLIDDHVGSSGADEIQLTARERQVLRGIRHGLTNKEIARDLDLSDITVKLHVRSILKKCGLQNRTQLAMMGSIDPASSRQAV